MPTNLLDNANATDCAGTLGNVRLLPLYFGGHCFYVAKCIRGAPTGDDPASRQIGGIVLPDCFWVNTTFTDEDGATHDISRRSDVAERTWVVTVLAIGPAVGTRCTKKHAMTYKRPRSIASEVKVGDKVLCADTAYGVQRSPICDYEYFIEEGIPVAVLQKGATHE